MSHELSGLVVSASCCDQIMILITHIENSFDKTLKIAVTFSTTCQHDAVRPQTKFSILSVVWRIGLLPKFLDITLCMTLLKLFNNMLCKRYLTVYNGEKKNTTRLLNA